MKTKTLINQKSRAINIQSINILPLKKPQIQFKNHQNSHLKIHNQNTLVQQIPCLKNKTDNKHFYSNFNIYKKKKPEHFYSKYRQQIKQTFSNEKVVKPYIYYDSLKLLSDLKLPEINTKNDKINPIIKKRFLSNMKILKAKRKYIAIKTQKKNLKNLAVENRKNYKFFTQAVSQIKKNDQIIIQFPTFQMKNTISKQKQINKKNNTTDLFDGWDRQETSQQWQFLKFGLPTHNLINYIGQN